MGSNFALSKPPQFFEPRCVQPLHGIEGSSSLASKFVLETVEEPLQARSRHLETQPCPMQRRSGPSSASIVRWSRHHGCEVEGLGEGCFGLGFRVDDSGMFRGWGAGAVRGINKRDFVASKTIGRTFALLCFLALCRISFKDRHKSFAGPLKGP